MKVLKIDLEKCDGSQACMAACAKALFKTEEIAFSSILIRSGEGGKVAATLCDQCGECVSVCPPQALYRAKNGTVMLKKELCTGCLICVGYCRKGAMMRVPGSVEPFKCVACGQCVKACPTGALSLEQQDHSNLPA
jgi:ferredoxin